VSLASDGRKASDSGRTALTRGGETRAHSEEESMKEYHEPKVTEYGEIREITEGGASRPN
jgi:hypothetical protein